MPCYIATYLPEFLEVTNSIIRGGSNMKEVNKTDLCS